jgi:hypothetical protein
MRHLDVVCAALAVLGVTSSCTVTQSRFEGGAGLVFLVDAGRPCADAGSVPDDNPCACPTDCARGAACLTEADGRVAGGQCIRLCTVPDGGSSGNSTCTPNATCFDFGGAAACVQRCTSAVDCPRGRLCDEGLCLTACTADEQCDSKQCRGNRCVTSEPAGLGAFEPCLRPEDCRSLKCSSRWRRCEQYCSMSRQDCPRGMSCISQSEASIDLGLCMPDCAPNRPCADPTLACQWAGRPYGRFACTPKPSAPCLGAPLTVSIGGRCTCNSDCTIEGRCVTEAATGFPGGFCVDRCSVNADCPDAFVCVGASAATRGFCRARCTVDGDCGRGRYCFVGVCNPFCDSSADCTDGRMCSPHLNSCVTAQPAGAATGAACRQDGDCKSNNCSSAAIAPGEPGVCTQVCKVAQQTCPDGTTCLDSAPNRNAGFCAEPCTPGTRCTDPAMECLPSIFPPGLGTFCRYR